MYTTIFILLMISLVVNLVLMRAYQMDVFRLEKVCDAYHDTLRKVDPSGEWRKVKEQFSKGLQRRAGFWGFLTGR